MTRRSVSIRAGAAITAAALQPVRAETADIDIAIVGAGAAGLAAATRCRTLGLSCVVLEARQRLGGRVFTDDRLGQPFDAGAAYLHWADRNPWRRIAAELGVELTDEPGGGPPRLYANGERQPSEARAGRWRAFSRIEARIAAATDPDLSLAEAVRPDGPADGEIVGGMTRLMLGEEPGRVSSADYEALWEGDDLVCPTGFGTLVSRYGAGLPVRLGVPVSAIDWSGPGVRLDTPAGPMRARATIVTASIGVLAAGAIAIRPALPGAVAAAIDGLRMGAYTKVVLRLDREAARSTDIADAIDTGQGGSTMSFDARPFGRDLVVCTFGGDFARGLCEAGEPAAVAHVTERLVRLFGRKAGAAVTGGVLSGWWTDPWSRGGYSIARPEHAGARLALREAVGERIWLAGEASAGGGAMTAGGAALDGERAATAVGVVLKGSASGQAR